MKNKLANQDIFEVNAISSEIIDLLEKGDISFALDKLASLHISDYSHLLEILPKHMREMIVLSVDISILKNLILWLPDYILQEIIDIKGIDFVVSLVKDFKSEEDQYNIVKNLQKQDKEDILNAISIYKRLAIEKKLNYPKDSAGRLMHTSFVVALKEWTTSQLLDYLKEIYHNAPAGFDVQSNLYDIFIIEENGEIIGAISLKALFVANQNQKILDISNEDFKSINVNVDQEQVALLFRKRGLSSIAVVDDNNILVGVINADDVIDVIYSESQEDFLLTTGVNYSYNNYQNIFYNSFSRLKWLMVNFIEAVTIPFIVILFKGTIEKNIIVTAIVQFVVALGGNSGGQSLSITIRGLALNLISSVNAKIQIYRELSIAFINGITLGCVGLVWGYLFGDGLVIGIIAFIAVWINIVMGASFGTLFPMLFKKLKIDPAIASSICVTTFTDICGFFLVLLIASILL